MKMYNLKDMVKGWFIGDFEPSAIRTKGFEVGVLKRPVGLERPKHFHKEATEITVLVKGSARINGKMVSAGDIFILEKNTVVDAEYFEESELVVVKIPSVMNDKYLVSDED